MTRSLPISIELEMILLEVSGHELIRHLHDWIHRYTKLQQWWDESEEAPDLEEAPEVWEQSRMPTLKDLAYIMYHLAGNHGPDLLDDPELTALFEDVISRRSFLTEPADDATEARQEALEALALLVAIERHVTDPKVGWTEPEQDLAAVRRHLNEVIWRCDAVSTTLTRQTPHRAEVSA